MRYLVLLSLILAFASPSLADVERWEKCEGISSGEGSSRIKSGDCSQYAFDVTSSTGDETSFRVDSAAALVSFEDDVLLAALGAGTVSIEHCIAGYAASDLTCVIMTSGVLDGTGGAPGTQLRSLRVAKGLYRIQLVGEPVAAEWAVVTVEGDK